MSAYLLVLTDPCVQQTRLCNPEISEPPVMLWWDCSCLWPEGLWDWPVAGWEAGINATPVWWCCEGRTLYPRVSSTPGGCDGSCVYFLSGWPGGRWLNCGGPMGSLYYPQTSSAACPLIRYRGSVVTGVGDGRIDQLHQDDWASSFNFLPWLGFALRTIVFHVCRVVGRKIDSYFYKHLLALSGSSNFECVNE